MDSLQPFLQAFESDPQAASFLTKGGSAFVSPALRPYVIAAAIEHADALFQNRPVVVVTSDDRQATELGHDLAVWLHDRSVHIYPSRGVTYQSHLSPPPHLVGLRVAALNALLKAQPDKPPVVVAAAAALSEKIPDSTLRPEGFTLTVGELLDIDECAQELVRNGYERVDQVTERGQFALRGNLVDIFPATAQHAVRVDLFDIEIESIKAFSTFTQRSIDTLKEIVIDPAAELAHEHRELAALIVSDEEESPRTPLTELLPVERFSSFFELAENVTVINAYEEELAQTYNDLWEDVTTALHDEDAGHIYVRPQSVLKQVQERTKISLSSFNSEQPFRFHAQAVEPTVRSPQELERELEQLLQSNYRTVVAWRRKSEGDRARYNLTRLSATWLVDQRQGPPVKEPLFAFASLNTGFIAPAFQLAVLPDHRLIRRRRQRKGAASLGKRGVLRSFADLAVGDIVVHEDHGVARFAGFETKTVAGITRDYLELAFAGTDKVFVPSDQLSKLSRYMGAGSGEPTLSKLGGSRWEAMKTRARRAAQELAGELLVLYAERQNRKGKSFPVDSDWQREFEDRFPFSETADQLEAIEQVKADMESQRPMDRLICGDVGYGKTEVALRAAFKALDDGKQVLMLVPTTILVQQHFGTFAERLKDYPFQVEHVSRFRSKQQQQEALRGFCDGKVDMLIGTHRLLGADVQPKDLGLVIVDEEQRFGVKQKELLRQLKLRVDVIAMSATPIPRTLQMSLAGLRDISTIATPPEGRRPVKTFVGPYDEQLVKQALEREAARDGQAFFLHNRVETIDETAERLRGLCPKLRFLVAHGQLDDEQLEEKMLAFLRGEADVLVCTSIIESGIDIPQANTLIVDRSDMFGMAQLYQIRGRVGRGKVRGYAYLLYPSQDSLTEEAAKRLAALADFTELGSGFKVAMRDLELRGAGNLLGDEQSGHVAALGFELYMQMLDEAVQAQASEEETGETRPEPVRLDVNIDAYVPADYIAYEQAKIDVHRRIAGAVELAELGQLLEELTDRFGDPPQPLLNLIELQRARILFGLAGATTVMIKAGKLTVTPIELKAAQLKQLRESMQDVFYESAHTRVTLRLPSDASEQLAKAVALGETLLRVKSSEP